MATTATLVRCPLVLARQATSSLDLPQEELQLEVQLETETDMETEVEQGRRQEQSQNQSQRQRQGEWQESHWQRRRILEPCCYLCR
ncbi:GM17629 [Drosophila sechellia]|uniref:GM17629 n=1 Tax=Drosophila sechellia TaxID=7238 RepID=B4IG54_DROSE|nr:GM17629 [Drosophila sechellia]